MPDRKNNIHTTNLNNNIMKKLLLRTMVLLCALVVGTSIARAQATVYTTGNNITWTHSNGVIIAETTYDACKMGKGSSTTVTVPVGTTKLYVHCAAWNGESANLGISAPTGVTITPTSWTLTADSGIAGSSTNFTLNTQDNASTSYYKEFTLSGVTSASAITFTTASNKRAVIWGINAEAPVTPSITASNVNLEYNATNGSIGYTIGNPSNPAGTLTAAITAGNVGSWLTLGAVSGSSVAMTCSANNTSVARTAIVRLTYTYDTNKTVTKDVTVTQADNPNVYDDISSVNAASTPYKVKGTVVATNNKGYIIGDGTGYVYVYLNATPTKNVNDKVSILGTTESYGNVIQFTNTATITETATSNYDKTPACSTVDATAMAVYNSGLHLSDYVQFEGTLAKNSSYYDITVGTATARISYPTSAQSTALDALVNKLVRVKGYFAGVNSSKFMVVLESAEEVSTPVIIATPTSRTGFTYMPGYGPSTAKTISVTGSNLTANITLTSSSDYEMCLTENGDYTNSLTLTQTAGAVSATTVYVRLKAGLTSNDYAGTITLTSTGATDVTVNLTGNVITTTSLPFSWTGGNNTPNNAGETELAAETGVEVNLGGGFAASNAPYRLKFDAVGKYVIVYTDEKPEAVSFTAKLFAAASTGSKIKVQGSTDGITFTDIQEFTIKGAANSTFEFTTTEAFNTNHRAVKLIMSAKDQNVGVGAISISSASAIPVTITDADYAIVVPKQKVDFTDTGVKAYTAEVGSSNVVLTEVKKVAANTPVVVYKDVTATTTFNIPVTTADADAIGTNNLLVSDGSITSDDSYDIYALASKGSPAVVGFYHVKAGTKVPAGKCYIRVAKSSSARELFGFAFDDEAMGVNEMKAQKIDGQFYDLQGRKVANPTKGLYIVNGKKVIIK